MRPINPKGPRRRHSGEIFEIAPGGGGGTITERRPCRDDAHGPGPDPAENGHVRALQNDTFPTVHGATGRSITQYSGDASPYTANLGRIWRR